MKIVETKTADGVIFNGLISEPNRKTGKIIIHIHGMAGSVLFNKYYSAMHDQYPQNGYAFLVGENRGTGTITEFTAEDTPSGFILAGSAMEKFEDCVIDTQSWINFAMNLGYEEIWLQSHSMGTSKVAYYIYKIRPTNIAGLIFISPSDMIGCIHTPEDQKDYDILLPEAKNLVSEGKSNQILSIPFWGSEYVSAETFLNLFEDGTNMAIFNFGDDSLGWKVINEINVPVIAFTGTIDDGIAPVIDPKLAMNKLRLELKNSPRVKTIVYEDADHGFDGFEDKIVEDVVQFIKEK